MGRWRAWPAPQPAPASSPPTPRQGVAGHDPGHLVAAGRRDRAADTAGSPTVGSAGAHPGPAAGPPASRPATGLTTADLLRQPNPGTAPGPAPAGRRRAAAASRRSMRAAHRPADPAAGLG